MEGVWERDCRFSGSGRREIADLVGGSEGERLQIYWEGVVERFSGRACEKRLQIYWGGVGGERLQI